MNTDLANSLAHQMEMLLALARRLDRSTVPVSVLKDEILGFCGSIQGKLQAARASAGIPGVARFTGSATDDWSAAVPRA